MNIQKLFALCTALTLLLTSCGGKGGEAGDTALYTPDTVPAIEEAKKQDHTQDPEASARLEELSALFSDVEEAPVDQLRFTVADGQATLCEYLGAAENVRIPASLEGVPVTRIASNAFATGKDIKVLILPDTVTAAEENALSGCSSLVALHTPIIGDGGEQGYLGYLFGSAHFDDNGRDVPASLVALSIASGVTALDDHALFDCNDLEYIALPDTLTELGSYALYRCNRLIALDVSNLQVLGDHALRDCSRLTKLDFGNDLQSVGLGALLDCKELRRLTLPFVGGTREENTYLGYVFGAEYPDFAKGFYPDYLVEINLTDTCTVLGGYAFFECESLERVTLSAVQSIGIRAFYGCTRLSDCAMPDALEHISENAFMNCLSLKALSFGAGSKLTDIGINAFYGCQGLTSVSLPASLSSLPASCFADCHSLTEVELGGVLTVGKNAFHRCTRLKKLSASHTIEFAEGNVCAERCLDK